MWSPADIADAVAAGLADEAARLDREQAVYGLDALDELGLHPIVAASLERGGYGVHREERYPSCRPSHRRLTEGERCDFVLTRGRRPLVTPAGAGTLFEPADAVHLDEAYWLEVKAVAQFTPEGPNAAYSSELLSVVRGDLFKLGRESGILHGGLLLLLFVGDERVAEHDVRIWYERCVARGAPMGYPSRRIIPITDRLGHSACAIVVAPAHHL
jgi:hypothetical protein